MALYSVENDPEFQLAPLSFWLWGEFIEDYDRRYNEAQQNGVPPPPTPMIGAPAWLAAWIERTLAEWKAASS